jgi:hypothetical protein
MKFEKYRSGYNLVIFHKSHPSGHLASKQARTRISASEKKTQDRKNARSQDFFWTEAKYKIFRSNYCSIFFFQIHDLNDWKVANDFEKLFFCVRSYKFRFPLDLRIIKMRQQCQAHVRCQNCIP